MFTQVNTICSVTLCCWGAALNAGREWGQVSWHKLAKGMLPTREGHAQCVNWRSYLGGVWLLFGDMLHGQQLYHASLFFTRVCNSFYSHLSLLLLLLLLYYFFLSWNSYPICEVYIFFPMLLLTEGTVPWPNILWHSCSSSSDSQMKEKNMW